MIIHNVTDHHIHLKYRLFVTVIILIVYSFIYKLSPSQITIGVIHDEKNVRANGCSIVINWLC